MADQKVSELVQPIKWGKDDDETIIRKINARIDNTKELSDLKMKEYRRNDAYLDGEPERVDPSKPRMIYNYLFPIVRNMTGLVTDVKPRPAAKVVNIDQDTPKEEVDQYLKIASKTEKSLDEWFEDNKVQSKFQRIVMSLMTYDDYFVMPYWDTRVNDALFYYVHGRHIHIDMNACEIDEAEHVVVDLFKGYTWMEEQFGEDLAGQCTYRDYKEAAVYELGSTPDNTEYQRLKNVCKVELYMEREWWVYKSGGVLLKKLRNPLWALSEDEQRADITERIRAKYEKPGIAGAVGKVMDTVKGAVGMETMDDKMQPEIDDAMGVFQPADNYFPEPRIPIVQFETFRMAGEMFSRSIMKQAIPTIDDMNKRKEAISRSAETMGEPTVFVSAEITEEQAKKIKFRSGKPIRIPTKSNRSINDLVKVEYGMGVPQQFFDDLMHDERAVDNLFGHHEVSKGGSDPQNRTKGGILALQEADQTPVRLLTRSLEDSFQDLFNWVIQIRKMKQKAVSVGKVKADMTDFLDYSEIDNHVQVYVKSGSMMPVSKEQQRADAFDMWNAQAIDPLTFHERLGDPHAEQTAERLSLWLTEKRIMTDDMLDAQARATQQIQLIKENRFDEALPQEGDDPRVHHDMLVMALKSNQFTPEQEKFIAELIEQYAVMAGNPVMGGAQAPAGAPPAQPPA